MSCIHMNCCLQKYTKHQFTYFIYDLFQDISKDPKIIKIQQIHQEIHTKQFLFFYLNCFLLLIHLNFIRKRTKDTFKGSLFGCQEKVSNTTLTIV